MALHITVCISLHEGDIALSNVNRRLHNLKNDAYLILVHGFHL